jgi:hypothetical protein
MAKIRLERACVSAAIRQHETSGVSQHVRMHLEAYFGGDAGTLDQLLQSCHGERCSALGDENERRLSPAF